MWAFVLMNILTFGIMNVKIWFDNTCFMNSSLLAYLWISKYLYCHYLTISLVQSRGGSPLSPFLDHLGSPPPAHMSALRSVLACSEFLLQHSFFRAGSLYPFPPQYAGAYGSLGMEQLAAWHQVILANDCLTTADLSSHLTPLSVPQASMYGHRAASPYSLTPPPALSRYSPGAGPGSSLPHPHPGLGFPHLPHHHLPHVKHDFDRPPGLLHPDDKVRWTTFKTLNCKHCFFRTITHPRRRNLTSRNLWMLSCCIWR